MKKEELNYTKMNKMNQDLRLLPNKYKKVAYGLMVLTILITALAIVKVIQVEKEVAKTIFQSGILAALLLLAITQDKTEDELTHRIRLKAFTFSFIFGVAYVIVEPVINLLFGGQFIPDDMNTAGHLLTMFFVYFGMIYLMKKNR